jgi:hypothetical protein
MSQNTSGSSSSTSYSNTQNSSSTGGSENQVHILIFVQDFFPELMFISNIF